MTAPTLVVDDKGLVEQLVVAWTTEGTRIALVPTMGALHDGHASLIRLARDRAGADGVVVVSVFVNPLQFGPGEDYERYPRTLAADLDVCEREGVDVVFAPSVEFMYPTWPAPPSVTVDPGPLGDVLEGHTRPGHFRGVLTVVARLVGLVRPDVTVFGEKDFQQYALVRLMLRELFPYSGIASVPIQRDPDGLALSSRNRYLDGGHRRDALVLHRALAAARRASVDGVDAALAAAHAELDLVPEAALDYLVVTDPDLQELSAEVPPGTWGRILIAARLGATRLIDNERIRIGPPARERSEPGPTEPEGSRADPAGAFPMSEARA